MKTGARDRWSSRARLSRARSASSHATPGRALRVCVAGSLAGGAAARMGQVNLRGSTSVGLARTYSLHVPAGLEHPEGLVVNLHGAGAIGAGWECGDELRRRRRCARRFVVVYPDGIDFSWADGRGASVARPSRELTTSASSPDWSPSWSPTSASIRATCSPPGCQLVRSWSTASPVNAPTLFAAIAPVAGTLGANMGCAPSRPVAVLATHGTADPVVPFNGGPMVGRGGPSDIISAPEMAARWSEAGGPVGVPTRSTVGGHIWPGGASAGGGAVLRQLTRGSGTGGLADSYALRSISMTALKSLSAWSAANLA